MTDRELMQQALKALDSDNPDIQLRSAVALRNRMLQPEPLFSTPDVTPEVTPYVIDCPRCGHCCPQRQWVELTHLELLKIWKGTSAESGNLFAFYQAIEAKLKEKNT